MMTWQKLSHLKYSVPDMSAITDTGKKHAWQYFRPESDTQSFVRCSFILVFDHKVDLAASVND